MAFAESHDVFLRFDILNVFGRADDGGDQTIVSVIIHEVHSRSKLTAVSKFEGLDSLHMWARNKPLTSNLKYSLQKTRKWRLCVRIFGSAYFNHIGIRARIYTSHLPHRRPSKTRRIYVYNESIRDVVAEHAFACRCKTTSRDTPTVKYFVSDEYDVSDAPDQYIAGRFIFARNKGDFSYEALAEEPATAVEGENVEKQYLDARGDRAIASTASADPLCKLEMPQKLRLCALVLNSTFFAVNEFHFSGTLDYVYGNCLKMPIIFRTNYSREKVNKRKNYEEWMMACHAKKPGEPTVFFYVSRAYASHKVFVYFRESSTDRMFLESLFSGVRGINDEDVGER